MRSIRWLVVLPVLLVAAFARGGRPVASFPLNSSSNLSLTNGKAEVVSYRGRQAVHLVATEDSRMSDGDVLAVIAGPDFKDGTIEVEVAGSPRADAADDARGFIGLAFRLHDQNSKGEYFYLRPTNARCDDQLRRNHSTQYVSTPDYPWQRLRKENPGVYESYVDLDPGAWTKMKIVVSGTKAMLYVNGASQPALVVTDLKHGENHGQIALWAHATTDAYFSNLTVR